MTQTLTQRADQHGIGQIQANYHNVPFTVYHDRLNDDLYVCKSSDGAPLPHMTAIKSYIPREH